jgi:hypothetical protein
LRASKLTAHELEQLFLLRLPTVASCELSAPQPVGFPVAADGFLDSLDEARRPVDENDVGLHLRELRDASGNDRVARREVLVSLSLEAASCIRVRHIRAATHTREGSAPRAEVRYASGRGRRPVERLVYSREQAARPLGVGLATLDQRI